MWKYGWGGGLPGGTVRGCRTVLGGWPVGPCRARTTIRGNHLALAVWVSGAGEGAPPVQKWGGGDTAPEVLLPGALRTRRCGRVVSAEVPPGTCEQRCAFGGNSLPDVNPAPCSLLHPILAAGPAHQLRIHKPSPDPLGPCLPGGTQGLSRLSLSPPQTSQGPADAQRGGDKPSPQRRGAILNKEWPSAGPDLPRVVLAVRLVNLRLSVLGGPWLPKCGGLPWPVGCCGQRYPAALGASVLLRTGSVGERPAPLPPVHTVLHRAGPADVRFHPRDVVQAP